MPTSTAKVTEVDVLIIGAGPAGLMAGNALANAGVNVHIIDKRPNKIEAGQADGIQPRTIEVFQSYGLADRLLAEANQMHVAAFYNPNTSTGGIELTDRTPDISDTSTRYPFEATLHQGAIEAIFLDSMRSLGVEISRPVVPLSIHISESDKYSTHLSTYPVRVVLKHLEPLEGQAEVETVHAKFVIGGDGAHSWVRKSLNIEMQGEQTDFVWGVVDMIPDTDFPDIRNKCIIHSTNGACMIIPREGDKIRVYIQLGNSDAVDTVNGRINKDRMGPEQLLDVARKSIHPFTINKPKAIDWWTIYQIGQRVASKFAVDERIFIAGDACHTHSPKAGQGMNASMNDTHNLAWKLVHVIRGWADISILKTYELERRTYAQDLINFDKHFAKLFSGEPRTEKNLDGISHENFIEAFKKFGGFTSGLGICYADSLICNSRYQSHAQDLTIGKRLPPQTIIRAADSRPFHLHDLLPSDTRFKVLVFAGDTSQPSQRARLAKLAVDMESPHGFLRLYSPNHDIFTAFDIITISSTKNTIVRYTDVPELFRFHWSKVFYDGLDIKKTQGGDAYLKFGIDPTGVVVIVRPDGYVGMVAPFDKIQDINLYFTSFTKSAPVTP